MTIVAAPKNQKEQLALQLAAHYRGKISGGFVRFETWRGSRHKNDKWWNDLVTHVETTDTDGNETTITYCPCENWEEGDLLPHDALYVVDFALSRGVNPYSAVHIWYNKGKIEITLHWRVIKGWAEYRSPFRTYYQELTPAEIAANEITEGDIAIKALNVLDAEKPGFVATVLKWGSFPG